MTKGERIREARLKKGLTMDELAELCNTTKQTIYKYENDIITNIPSDKIELLAKALNVTPEYIMGWSNDDFMNLNGLLQPEVRTLPVLGEIACGEPIFATEDIEYISLADAPSNADFILIAKGDSMINARIYDGDYIFIHKQPFVHNGEIAAVIIGDEVTLKRVYFNEEKQKIVLNPENPAYEPLVYVGEELKDIKILGKAIAFQSEVR